MHSHTLGGSGKAREEAFQAVRPPLAAESTELEATIVNINGFLPGLLVEPY